ncbi:LacI family DNA-binding transcriptional regulator [Paenibacillus sp. Marseille-Q4541]|uniref:LacI family DNA-binding transcriptional regulator n=1 Tax=Paenibacillus sp. Marseille-Q4541 TaxID=2831522 RepID=UPI002019DDD2|nr:LacI family DNA-binding transcriptional regulator [Paenibacillus sp. Marseille-Q4541]
MTKPKITMQDIADHLQISKNSVSQALSGKDGVSEETRKLVIQTADALGYIYTGSRKKSFDQESSYTNTGSIALVATDFAFSQRGFFGEIYLTVEQEVQRGGKKLLIQSISQQMMNEGTLPPFIEQKEVDGILILSHLSTEYMNKLIQTGIPAVLIDHHHPDVQADAILTNNRFSAYHVVKYLYELGHRKIGYIGNISFSPSYYERLEGYHLAHHDLGMEVHPEWIIKDALEDQEFIATRLRDLQHQPTAWFCVNDGLGFFVNSALYNQGYQVPTDISIVSFDNGQLSRLATPSTTTMAVDLTLFGKKAVRQLFWRIKNPESPYMEMLLPTVLLERDSTAAPRD